MPNNWCGNFRNILFSKRYSYLLTSFQVNFRMILNFENKFHLEFYWKLYRNNIITLE